MKDNFSRFHPAVNFTYFTLVILFSMVFMHPACLVVSLIAAFSYSIYLNGKKAIKFNFMALLPMLVLMAVINPAFNHEGVTILAYLRSGNPLTLESIIYGAAAACMIITVIAWFSAYNAIMTSDKFIYLFGKIMPALSLILSMVLRFVPRFKEKIKEVSNAQRCIGRDVSQGSVLERIKKGVKILSIMTTWALENAIETADSMKCRGYGLSGRTAFSIFYLEKRDIVCLVYMLALSTYVFVESIIGNLYYRYFPSFIFDINELTISVLLAYTLLLFTPLFIELYYEIKWRSYERI